MGFFKKNRVGMELNGLNWCFFPSPNQILWDFSFTMCLREICGICVRRGGRCREDVGGFGNVGNCD